MSDFLGISSLVRTLTYYAVALARQTEAYSGVVSWGNLKL